MKLYLVRHGKTQLNIDGLYNGVVDEEVCDIGIEDLTSKVERYTDLEFDYIYSSPLIRCQQTFNILFQNQKINELRDDIKEMDFGEWYNTSIIENLNHLKKLGFTMDDYVDPPNGETYKDFFIRTSNFIENIINKHEDDEQVLVVCHGLVIAAILKNHFLLDEIFYLLTPENGLGYIIDTKTNSITKI